MRLEPLLGVDLVGAQHRADLVVEDLGRGAGQGAQPGVHQPPEVVGERLAEALGALGDLERGEAVDVDVGRGVLHRPGDVDVVVAVEVRVDAALQAHLGGAERRPPRRPALRCRRASSRYGVPRRLSDSGPFEKPQNRHLNVQTFV